MGGIPLNLWKVHRKCRKPCGQMVSGTPHRPTDRGVFAIPGRRCSRNSPSAVKSALGVIFLLRPEVRRVLPRGPGSMFRSLETRRRRPRMRSASSGPMHCRSRRCPAGRVALVSPLPWLGRWPEYVVERARAALRASLRLCLSLSFGLQHPAQRLRDEGVVAGVREGQHQRDGQGAELPRVSPVNVDLRAGYLSLQVAVRHRGPCFSVDLVLRDAQRVGMATEWNDLRGFWPC